MVKPCSKKARKGGKARWRSADQTKKSKNKEVKMKPRPRKRWWKQDQKRRK